jgi:hypothetical protein
MTVLSANLQRDCADPEASRLGSQAPERFGWGSRFGRIELVRADVTDGGRIGVAVLWSDRPSLVGRWACRSRGVDRRTSGL